MAETDKLPKELREKIIRARNYLPEFLKKKYEELDENPELNEKRYKITDFLSLMKYTWIFSDKDYQERIWVNRETTDIFDSYDESTTYFFEDAEGVLEAGEAGRVKMTDKQYNMLKHLYEIVETYDYDYKETHDDRNVVYDPRWNEIREYAKLVYEEIIKG